MADVFSDLGKMPDASELLTICRRSLYTEVKTVFKKSDGIMSRVQVVVFRRQTVSSWIFKSTILNCDITSELFLDFRRRLVFLFVCVA